MHKYNLQFFATEGFEDSSVATGAEVDMTSDADLSEGTVEDVSSEPNEDSVNVDDATTPDDGKEVDMNAIYASARRRAEEEADKKINALFAKRFGSFTNPLTGGAINSYQDYLDALDAQEQMKREAELREKGVDTSLIKELIDNNPAVRQANEVLERERNREAVEHLQKEVEELGTYDPSIKSVNDIPKDIIEYALNKKISITEAYKINNFGKWSQQKAESARQAAINQVKGKEHLKPVDGVAVDDNLVEIPASQRGLWETMFPEKSWAERKKLYNKQL